MNTTYEFAPVPNNATVAGLVTVTVSAWFLVAAAAIFADPFASPVMREALTYEAAPTTVAAAPDAHFTIVVEAPRLKS